MEDASAIKEAARRAQALAEELWALMLASTIPLAHFDEVLERVRERLVIVDPSGRSENSVVSVSKDNEGGADLELQKTRERLQASTMQFVRRRVLDIASLPQDAREPALQRLEIAMRVAGSFLATEGATDFDLWVLATIEGIRLEIRRIENSGGATPGTV